MAERDYEVALEYLETLLRSEVRDPEMVRIAMTACRENLRQNPELLRSRLVANNRAHSYGPDRTPICDGDRRQLVFAAMQRNGAFSAPAWSHRPIQTGTVSVLWPLDDMVVRLVDATRLLVYNVTLPKHILFPGYVKLAVEVVGDRTVVGVSGRGTGNWAYANERGGRILFRSLLENLASHLRYGRHHREHHRHYSVR